MKVLVVGGGGREHALVWKASKSPLVSKIFVAPGNGGTGELAENVSIAADDVEALLEFALSTKIDLTIVGPEAPLVKGVVDRFRANNLRVFGPTAKASMLEGSKAFAKAAMKRYKIPTAEYEEFQDPNKAGEYIRQKGAPIVVKADGLAAGKGVVVAQTVAEALAAVDSMMLSRQFGAAGSKIVVEEFLEGEEASFIALCDGKSVLPLASSQDHKAAFDGDKGPNTGGMGAYSPAPILDEKLSEEVVRTIVEPMMKGLAADGASFSGVMYAGLMIKDGKPKVLEFNCRFGDPECQPILMRMKSDLIPIIEACIDGKLADFEIDWDPRTAVCVVLASGGYPGEYEKGLEISAMPGPDQYRDSYVFHAGTAKTNSGLLTNGGRVMGVSALGEDIETARNEAYRLIAKINWRDMRFRRDIGQKAIGRK